MPILAERLSLLESIELLRGAHKDNNGKCALEAVAWLAGEKHSDHPVCVCRTLAAFVRRWNDRLDDEARQKLRPFLPRMIGTRGDGASKSRYYMAVDWLVRECGPIFLNLAGLSEHADVLQALQPITNLASLESARPVIAKARAAADASRLAAFKRLRADAAATADATAAYATAAYAAYAAYATTDAAAAATADATATATAADAAYAAYAAAADAAAYAAAYAAKNKIAERLAPAVQRSQESAFKLLDRMINAKK